MHAGYGGRSPNNVARIGQRKSFIFSRRDGQGARTQGFAGGFFNGTASRTGRGAFQPWVALNAQAVQTAHIFARHQNIAIGLNLGLYLFAALQPPHQGGRVSVDKLPHEFHVQGIRQAVFNRSATFLPVLGVVQPVIAIGDICPGANMGKAR